MTMNIKMTVLALACALALAACSDNSSSPAAPGAAPSATASAPMQAPAPAASTPATTPTAPPAAAPATDGKPTAVVTDCATEIEGNDAMQYNVSSIVVPASCKDFKITLKHTGKLPVTAMMHDGLSTKPPHLMSVDDHCLVADGCNGFVKVTDPRVIAHTS